MRGKKHGFTLAVSLLISLAVILLGVIYTSFSVNESRFGRTINTRKACRSFALSGLTYALSYMGCPDNWENRPETRYQDDNGVIISPDYPKEHSTGEGFTWFGMPLSVKNRKAPDNPRYMTDMETRLPADKSGSAQGTWKITITPQESDDGAPPTQLISVEAIAEDGSGRPIGTYRVEAQVRAQTAADFALFIGDARGWDRPNAPPPTESSEFSNAAGFTDGFKASGDVRVDGSGYTTQELDRGIAGGVNIWGKDVKFMGKSIMDSQRVNITSGSGSDSIFLGRFTDKSGSMGLPPALGYLTFEKNSISNPSKMGLAESAAGTLGRIVIPDTYIEKDTGKSIRVDWRAGGSTTSSPLPGFPWVDITLSPTIDKQSTNITVNVVGYYTGKTLETKRFKLTDIPKGVIYVKGGNARIQGELTGKLTVVADENPDRDIYDEKIYYPVYNATKKKWYYPVPSKYESREGNICITGDITYGEAPSVDGLIAKNFIYLNDRNNRSVLTVNGVLMSFDHSVQYDWDNFARNPGNANVKGGTFEFTGAIVGKYVDVEGDVKTNKGYTKQHINFDPNLGSRMPPYFPQWQMQQMKDVVYYRLVKFEEKGFEIARPTRN